MWDKKKSLSSLIPEAKNPRVGRRESGEEAVEEEEDSWDDQSLLPSKPVRDLAPEGGADHHPDEDDGGEEGLPVLIYPPLAVQSQGEDGEDHHLHAVRHPAETDDDAEYNLESTEADAVDGLGHREGVVRYNSAGSSCKREAWLGSLILECVQQSKSTVAFSWHRHSFSNVKILQITTIFDPYTNQTNQSDFSAQLSTVISQTQTNTPMKQK